MNQFFFIDTCTLLFYFQENPQLSSKAKQYLQNAEALLVSAISLMEIAIKINTGKLEIKGGLETVLNFIDTNPAIYILPISNEAMLLLQKLPLHHRDPWDRLIIAECLHGQYPIISCDGEFKQYEGLEVVW